MRPPPPLLALAAGFAQRALDRRGRPPTKSRNAAAALTAAASLALAGASAAQFHRSGTTVEPFEPSKSTALVTGGVNQLTRNPMYVGMAGLLVADSLRRGSLVGLAPVAGFVAVMNAFQVAVEEHALQEKFGNDYEAYCASVPRWIGIRSFARQRSGGARRA
ncbi:isoprenylcysteine carboxylmethyltransferase family protein [Nocardioides seonyuensis]|uniref:Isoprenylcysteine carboxylmethyltransferase family protein n=1 Tax=Nocardioides seonyuensis TaxID=2518371 RepID=A0A4P7ID38_9ACTN|nr:isoprenylcysteine carboxylmethyltransferase family protein [Nocardioides seonyuensis]QBX55036.1 isoprenylcysteine carboxylmethyltransferase family protein [Nocardioides seonyuensis]